MKFPLRLIALAVIACAFQGAAQGGRFDISPDGKTIVFSADGELYRLTLKTRQVTRLTNTALTEDSPVFSPDGGSIIYSAGEPGRQGSRLFRREIDGKLAQPLTSLPDVADFSPSFSPDGQQIAFMRAHRLRESPQGGKRWADFDVYVLSTAGGEPRRLTQENYWEASSPSFSPDGVIFTGTQNLYPAPSHSLMKIVGKESLQKAAALGSEPPADSRRIGAWVSSPRVAADGELIAFVSDRAKPFAYDLYLMNHKGGEPSPLGITSLTRRNADPVFEPDSKKILFLGVGKGQEQYGLWEVDVDGKNAHEIADSRLFADPMNWKPKTE